MNRINWIKHELSDNVGVLNCCPADGEIRPAILICPGGGYYAYSKSDCELIPACYLEHGYRPFVLLYGIRENAHYPRPLLEASEAIWYIRSHHQELGIDPDRIVVAGFSAGAHVAAMISCLWDKDLSREGLDIPYGGNKPNATVTGYTPTEFESFTRKNPEIPEGPVHILGEKGSYFAEIESLTATNYINENTPPAFLWKTTADAPESTTEYYRCLRKYGIDCEIHIFTDVNRAVGMHFDPEMYPDQDTSIYAANLAFWPQMSINWLEMQWKTADKKK